MKLFLVVLAALVIATNAACTIKFDYKCSAGDACDNIQPTSTDWKVCGDSSMQCISSVCTKKPVLGEACTVSTPCYDEDFFRSSCISSKCTAVYYKNGDADCTSSSECISQSCVGGKCTVVASGSACLSDQSCVGGKFCQSTSTTSILTCSDLFAADATCFKTTDACVPGYLCTAKLTGVTYTAGKCVAFWSQGKGAQCSGRGQCADGLWCDMDSNSASYQTCIEPVADSGTCTSLQGCANANLYCDTDECKCKGQKEHKDSDVADKLKSFTECLDEKNCHATNANAGSCGADCLSKAKDVNKALHDNEVVSVRQWNFANAKDACDSASTAAVSFLFVVAMALLAL